MSHDVLIKTSNWFGDVQVWQPGRMVVLVLKAAGLGFASLVRNLRGLFNGKSMVSGRDIPLNKFIE